MASNISQDTLPPYWSSANDDVIFKFKFNPYAIDQVYNNGGNVQINLENDFDITPLPGEYIYLQTDVYTGIYKVLSSLGTSQITIELPYTTTITTHIYNCYHIRVPVFTIYKGYKVGEHFPLDLPYTKVFDLKPSIIYNELSLPYISINIKGLTKYLFKIIPNSVANSVDFSMFNAIRIVWDDLSTVNNSQNDFNLVLNSAIKTEDLNLNYIAGGIYLVPIDKPEVATSGCSMYSIFEVIIKIVPAYTYPVIHKFINGVKQ